MHYTIQGKEICPLYGKDMKRKLIFPEHFAEGAMLDNGRVLSLFGKTFLNYEGGPLPRAG